MTEANLSVNNIFMESDCYPDEFVCIENDQASNNLDQASSAGDHKNKFSEDSKFKQSSIKSRWSLEDPQNIPEWHPPQHKAAQNSCSTNDIVANGSSDYCSAKQSASTGSLSASPPPFVPRNFPHVHAHQIFSQGNMCATHHIPSTSTYANHSSMFLDNSEVPGEQSSKPHHSHYVVNVFVHPRASFTFSVGEDQAQVIQGPATVRMVSNTPPHPASIPDQPGQMVHQIVDDNGVLSQVIISSQTSPPILSSSPQPAMFGAPPHIVMHGGPPYHSHLPRHHHPPPDNGSHPSSSTGGVANMDQRTIKRKERLQMKLHQRRNMPVTSTEEELPDGNCLKRHAQVDSVPLETTAIQKSTRSQNLDKAKDKDSKQLEMTLSKIDDPKVLIVEARSAVVRLNWCESPDLDIDPLQVKYRLLINKVKDDGPSFTEVYSGDALEIALNDLSPATVYYVKYQCWLGDTRGCLSPSVSFTTPSCEPEPPSWPKLVSKAKTSIQLKWNAAADNGSKITNYILECDEGHGSSKFVEVYNGPQKQFKVSKLQPSTGYRFRLAAVNSHGKSEYSDSVCYNTSGPVPSQTDPPMMSDPTSKSLTISWVKRPTDEVFTLQMEDETTGHGFLTVYNGPDLLYKVPNLRRNSEYKFRLQAKNEEGSSKWSDVVSFKTLPDKPLPPLKLQIKGKTLSSSFKFAWDEPKDNGGIKVEYYVVHLDDGSGFKKFGETPEKEMSIEDLNPGQSFKVKVQAVSNGGTSEFSDVLVVTTQPVAPSQCKPPKLQKGKVKSTHLSVSWEPPENDGGAQVTEYAIQVTCPNHVTREAYRGSDLSCFIAGLEPGETYEVQVRAVNKAGSGPWSEFMKVTTGSSHPEPPLKPDVICRSPQSAHISWSEPKNNGAEIIEYRLEWKFVQPDLQLDSEDLNNNNDNEDGDDNDDYLQLYSGSSSSYEVTKLIPASKYSFRVLAVNSVGVSPPSLSATCHTPPGCPSSVSSLHVVTVTASSVKLAWKRPRDNGSPLLLYHIDIGTGRIISVGADVNEYNVEGLMPETAYKLRIQAINNVGVGPYGPVIKTVTRSLPPDPPKLEVVSCGPKFVKLKWGDNKNLELLQYCLEYSRDGENYSMAYQGTSHSHKVSKLIESSEYFFRIYAVNDAGDGPLSAPIKASTIKSPPPSMKAPHISDIDSNSCQIHWIPMKMPGCNDNFIYILQLSDSITSTSFHEVYRGDACKFRLTDLAPSCEYQVRVGCVRKCPDEDVPGPFSAATAFNTRVTLVSQLQTEQYSSSHSVAPQVSMTTNICAAGFKFVERIRKGEGMTEMHWAILLMFAFAVVAALLALVAKHAVDLSSSHS